MNTLIMTGVMRSFCIYDHDTTRRCSQELTVTIYVDLGSSVFGRCWNLCPAKFRLVINTKSIAYHSHAPSWQTVITLHELIVVDWHQIWLSTSFLLSSRTASKDSVI